MKIYYWSPYFSKVATVRSVLNSFKVLKENGYETKILNCAGEWSFINKKYRIDLNGKINIHKFFPKYGLIISRLYNIFVFLLSSFNLFKLIKNSKKSIIIAHLVTSLPILLNFFFFYKTKNKLILRISGLPRLTLIRKFLWKYLAKRCLLITSPTLETKNRLIKLKIFPKDKIVLLRDPVFRDLKKNKIKKKFNRRKFLAVGRLTKQKNFSFLIKSFSKMKKKYSKITLTILGEGEQHDYLKKIINKNNMSKSIFLKGYVNNINNYYKKYDCLVVSSLWEDPGFILIEAGKNNLPIISSNCFSGPTEILNHGKFGFLFKSNNFEDFEKKFDLFMNEKNSKIYTKVRNLKESLKVFDFKNHLKDMKNILKLS